jgi:hypothetical protein
MAQRGSLLIAPPGVLSRTIISRSGDSYGEVIDSRSDDIPPEASPELVGRVNEQSSTKTSSTIVSTFATNLIAGARSAPLNAKSPARHRDVEIVLRSWILAFSTLCPR